MDLEYTVTETVHRNRAGQIIRIDYQFEETITVETKSTLSSNTLRHQNKEKRSRTYDATVTREQYEVLQHNYAIH